MVLSEAGLMINQVCRELPEFIHNMDWVIYQIMPNHFHAIIELKNVGVGLREATTVPIRGAKAGLPLRVI